MILFGSLLIVIIAMIVMAVIYADAIKMLMKLYLGIDIMSVFPKEKYDAAASSDSDFYNCEAGFNSYMNTNDQNVRQRGKVRNEIINHHPSYQDMYAGSAIQPIAPPPVYHQSYPTKPPMQQPPLLPPPEQLQLQQQNVHVQPLYIPSDKLPRPGKMVGPTLQSHVPAGVQVVSHALPSATLLPPPLLAPVIVPTSISAPVVLPTKQYQHVQQPAVTANTATNIYSDSKKVHSMVHLQLSDLNLQHILGGGAFGQVWRGDWKGTPVAVKILSSACQSDNIPAQILSSFEDEIGILSQLRHPNICLFLGVCLDPPNRAIVTELVSASLWDGLRKPVSDLFPGYNYNDINTNQMVLTYWPTWAIQKVLSGMFRGIIYLHNYATPIIHRDLKSGNLLIDESLNVKICDFGLARLKDYTNNMTANVGTVQWIAPEVLGAKKYNEKVDIYSAGIIAWELMTGLCPYEGMGVVDIAVGVVYKSLRPQMHRHFTKKHELFLSQCWEQDPNKRCSAEDALANVTTTYSP